MKNPFRNKSYTAKQVVIASAGTVVAIVVIVMAIMTKFYALYNGSDFDFSTCLFAAIIVVSLLMLGMQLYIISSAPKTIKHANYYFAYMSVFVFVFVAGNFMSAISPLLIPVAFCALLVFAIARNKTHPFVLNTVCVLIHLMAGLLEYLITSGNVKTVFDLIGNEYLWELFVMCLVNILIGGLLPYCIKYTTKRTGYILICFIFDCLTFGLITLLVFVNPQLATAYDDLWLVAIAVFVPLVAGMIINPVIESSFNLVTTTRLVELTDNKQPLIERLIAEAPGTYNHCMTVANLAEICANAIGEDPYLARAAAYYHDVGKLENPNFFAENQSTHNPLDELLPEVSVQIIKGHTEKGYKLCDKQRIPDEIKNITIEHHGTLPITIFYERAKLLTDGEVDIKEYSYQGKTPTSKIAAIIMICDSGEAAIRAMDKPDGARVDKVLKSLIDDRIKLGQFDNCDISLKELNTVRQAINEAFGGLYHKRLKYPGGEK